LIFVGPQPLLLVPSLKLPSVQGKHLPSRVVVAGARPRPAGHVLTVTGLQSSAVVRAVLLDAPDLNV